jgi:hypothetical protein
MKTISKLMVDNIFYLIQLEKINKKYYPILKLYNKKKIICNSSILENELFLWIYKCPQLLKPINMDEMFLEIEDKLEIIVPEEIKSSYEHSFLTYKLNDFNKL